MRPNLAIPNKFYDSPIANRRPYRVALLLLVFMLLASSLPSIGRKTLLLSFVAVFLLDQSLAHLLLLLLLPSLSFSILCRRLALCVGVKNIRIAAVVSCGASLHRLLGVESRESDIWWCRVHRFVRSEYFGSMSGGCGDLCFRGSSRTLEPALRRSLWSRCCFWLGMLVVGTLSLRSALRWGCRLNAVLQSNLVIGSIHYLRSFRSTSVLELSIEQELRA